MSSNENAFVRMLSSKADTKNYNRVINGTLMDDPIMNRIFSQKAVLEKVLQIALADPTIKIRNLEVQKVLDNLMGRAARFDVLVLTEDQRQIDVEVQNAKEGFCPERTRYYHGILDSHTLQAGNDFQNLPYQIVLFFCGFDPCNAGLPVYHVEEWVRELNCPYGDRKMTVIFNTKCVNGDTDIHRLNWDMNCKNPKDMKLPELSNAMYKLKSSPEEVEAMCKEFSSTYLDGKAEGKLETALNMLSDGVLSFEKIAQYSGLSVEQVKELSKKMDEQ